MNAGVSRIGTCTSLGWTALASHAAFRAGLVAFAETEVKGRDGEPIRSAALSDLPASSSRLERMLALAEGALADLSLPPSMTVPWVLALPDSFVDGQQISEELRRRHSALRGKPALMTQGRSAFFFGLEHAQALLASKEEAVLVASVDSLCSLELLEQLSVEGRLLDGARHGVIPGEGAAFVLLERSGRDKALATLLQVSTAQEPNHFLQDKPNTAQGLSSVYRRLGKRRADVLYTCETGEPFWASELSMAYLRNVVLMPEPFIRTMAAEAFGDLGAAAGGVMFAMGVLSLGHRSHLARSLLLLCGASDHGAVGGCLVEGVNR